MDSSLRGVIALSLTQFAAWFTIGIYGLFLQLYAFYVLGATNFLVSLFATVYFILNAPSSFFGGYLLDRYGKPKLLLLISTFLLSISAFITPLFQIPTQLLIVRGIQGASIAIIIPLVNLLSARLLGTGRGVGMINMIKGLGFMIAALIGGVLADYISYTSLFYISGLVTAISFILVLIIPEDVYPRTGGYRIKISHIKKIGVPVWIIYIAFYIRQHAAGGVWSLFSLFLFSIGATNLMVGIANLISNLTQTLFFQKIGELSEGRGMKSVKLGLMLSIIVFSGYYFSNNMLMIMPIQVIIGISWVTIYAGANVFILENTSKEIQGTALGILNMFIALSWVTGSIMNGYITDLTGSYREYILIASVLSFIGFIFIEIYSHYEDRIRRGR